MSRRWLVSLPLALTVVGAAALSTVAAADIPPAPACNSGTPQVQNLIAGATNLGTALSAATPDPTALSQDSGDMVDDVTAAQAAGCLPALPTSAVTPPTPPAPPAPPTAEPFAQNDATSCTADTVQLLSASLEEIAAGIATTPDAMTLLKGGTGIATAITAINTDACLPAPLPVPTVPTPPVAPAPPMARARPAAI